MKKWTRKLCDNEKGTAVIEYALIAPLLLMLTFGIAEFSLIFWQWNAAEKATHMGARLAATRGPIMVGVPDCGVVTTLRAGTNCRDVAGSDSWSVVCDGSAPGAACDAVRMAEIVTEMKTVFSRIELENVIFEFRGVGLGFVGRGSSVPTISVSLQNLTYEFVALSAFTGTSTVNLPAFRATLVGEDLNSNGSG